MVWELFKGGVYFVQPEPDNQCGNNSRAEGIQGNTVYNVMYSAPRKESKTLNFSQLWA